MATILSSQPADLERVAALLRAGEIVALPTETVYGLAGVATDANAIRAIFAAKGRPATNPLIVHVPDCAAAQQVAVWNRRADLLAEAFWPGPLTMVLPKKGLIPELVTAGRATVAVRRPVHPVFHRVLELTGLPLAAPSANQSAEVSPTTAQDVAAGLGDQIDWIVDGGPCEVGLESTVVRVLPDQPVAILRPGGITREELAKTLGEPVARIEVAETAHTTLESPGQMRRHYAPRANLILHPPGTTLPTPDPTTAAVYLARPTKESPAHTFWLSETGDLSDAARQLYRVLHSLDEQGYARAHVEMPPESGMGLAIADRLRRAAAP